MLYCNFVSLLLYKVNVCVCSHVYCVTLIHVVQSDIICQLNCQSGKSNKISNNQELIQSDSISGPQNQKGNSKIHKLTTVYTKVTRGKPNEQIFPKQVGIQLAKIY